MFLFTISMMALMFFGSGTSAQGSGTSIEEQSECISRSFVFDSKDDFRSQDGGFDWCFERVKWWGLNTGDGWRSRYCSSRRYSIGYNQWRWSNNFRYQIHDYQSRRGGYDAFNFFSRFYSPRVFRGFPGRIEFSFDNDCPSGGYDLEAKLEEKLKEIYD